MPNEITVNDESEDKLWSSIPDSILLHVLSFLPSAKCVLTAAGVCRKWHRVAQDSFLWKDLFYWYWMIDPAVPVNNPTNMPFQQEYKRLFYHSPLIESEVLKAHRDQVLHVSFSHNGQWFATCSKDGFVKVWNAVFPASIKYTADLRKFNWKYTQYSQFNESDTLLLVSGVHFGSHSTSGEIAVFSMNDEFELQCRVINRPYDIFGTWYNDSYLLSGQLSWLGHLSSASVLWLNKANQESESERTSVVMKLLKFRNINASSVRTIMIAKCGQVEATCDEIPVNQETQQKEEIENEQDVKGYIEPLYTQCTNIKTVDQSKRKVVSVGQKIQMLPDRNNGILLLEVDSDNEDDKDVIEYNSDYRKVEQGDEESEEPEVKSASEELCTDSVSTSMELGDLAADIPASAGSVPSSLYPASHPHSTTDTTDDSQHHQHPKSISDSYLNILRREKHLCDTTVLNKTLSCQSELCAPSCAKVQESVSVSPEKCTVDDSFSDRYLIFTTGKKTYTPHQIGIKKIKSLEAARLAHLETNPQGQPESDDELDDLGQNRQEFDNVDHLIELDGHIIGMCLSPDHRYLYVNSRPWPKGYVVQDPLTPPPIAQEIDIHVIDLHTKQEVGTMLRAHKAYTPNDECFFIFLDVCDEYVASGAEDRNGYLWDRHYGILLTKFPHTDVVNSVAFNPKDAEVLVTVSDDNTIKIWRSRNRELEVKGRLPDKVPEFRQQFDGDSSIETPEEFASSMEDM